MTAKGGSLKFPSNPLDSMRELADLDALDSPHLENLADSRKSVNAETRTSVSTQVRKPASSEASKSAGEEARAYVSKSASPQVRKSASKPARRDGRMEMMAAVEAALEKREPLIGGVKATVDMSPELSSRAKRYLADHRGQSTRQVLIALFDAYLTEKGY